jgi:hypothetical protein
MKSSHVDSRDFHFGSVAFGGYLMTEIPYCNFLDIA